MTPDKEYSGRAKIRMYRADCMELMKSGKTWDLAIIDPPYGIGAENGISAGSIGIKVDTRNGYKTNPIKRTEYKSKDWDEKPDKLYFNKLFNASKNQIIWGMNHFILPETTCVIVWDKANVGTYQSDCELAWASFDTTIRKVTFMWSGGWQGKSIKEGHIMQGDKSKNEKRIHPTQKPVQLYKWLLTNYAKEGDTILDTHGGSLSIAIACWDLGFDLDICELDKDYFDAAVKRFEGHISQQVLF